MTDRGPNRPIALRLPADLDPSDPLATLLARYADARLSPSDEQVTRVQARLVNEYVARRMPSRSPAQRVGWLRRFALAAAVVLALTGGASLAAAASGPGQPLYHLRLTVESLTLPPQGSARVEALLGQLAARLAETRQASARGDAAAVADALAAYEATLASLSTTISQNGGDAHVLDELGRHEAVLQGLLDQVPSQAQTGLQRALDQTERARDAIVHRPATPQSPNATSRPLPSQAPARP